MKILLDEQISGRVAERLRARGHDVVAVTADVSLRGLSDPEIFSFAQGQKRALVTYNRDDFLAIASDYAQRGQEHHGLVIVNPKRIPSRDLTLLTDSITTFIETFSVWPSYVTWLP